MKGKIITILVMTLLISTTLISVVSGFENPPRVIDQEQTDTSELNWLEGGKAHVQEFINYGNMIQYVQVHIGHYYSGSYPMTLSIEKPLGSILTSKTLTVIDIPDNFQDWCTFDFPDVALQKNQKYNIVIQFDPGSEYAWSGAHRDPYPPGGSSHPDLDWDYAFRTHVDKARPRFVNTFMSLLEKHPNLFPLLRQFFGL